MNGNVLNSCEEEHDLSMLMSKDLKVGLQCKQEYLKANIIKCWEL